MNEIKVSIITVCYNSEKTIKRTIESVLNQSYINIEYTIIDGKSDDRTLDIIKHYASNYPFIRYISEKDSGIYDAMNKGIEMSSGEVIGIINSDDWYELNAVENIINAYAQNGDGIYYGLMRTILQNKELSIERFHHNFLGDRMIPHPTCFVSKNVYEKFGYFNRKYKSAADFDFLINLKKKGVNFYPLDVVITNFSIGGISSSLLSAIESINVKKNNRIITNKQFYLKYIELKCKEFLKKFLSYGK